MCWILSHYISHGTRRMSFWILLIFSWWDPWELKSTVILLRPEAKSTSSISMDSSDELISICCDGLDELDESYDGEYWSRGQFHQGNSCSLHRVLFHTCSNYHCFHWGTSLVFIVFILVLQTTSLSYSPNSAFGAFISEQERAHEKPPQKTTMSFLCKV